jgi:serine/threonine-protein kinase
MAQSPGKKLAHYRLVEKIGEGGMGEVWKARDEHLDRDTAVKVLARDALLDTSARQRFRREAHVLSRLSHPGVATIFDFDTQDGVDFLVMEYVPGGTLESRLRQGALGLGEVFRLGAEIGDALEDAHRRGFLHRDLKAGNVVLTETGQPKLLDFGIARLLHASPAATVVTDPGSVLGSLPYMAPEQLLGEADDVRTDVYSLGVLLFEMTTGQRPFRKDRNEALMFEILTNAPPSARVLRPEVPVELDRLIAACLSKEPARRPDSAGTVTRALRRIAEAARSGATAEPAGEAIHSLAVLPLENVSRDPAQEYFADGMTEALISDLARIQALRVISRTSAMKYKGATKALPDIARELNVDAILEGSALLVGNRVRISVRLVSARSDETLWADRYDRGLEDVLGLQSDVAEKVAKEIAIQVTPQEATQLAQRPAVIAEAHVEYLKGRHALAAASPQAVELSLRHFRRALELDPGFAPAWAGMSDAHRYRAARGMAPPAEASAESEAAARKALELDDSLAEAHAALGAARSGRLDLAGGMRSLRRAIELNPGQALAYYWLGRDLYCSARHAEAQEAMLKALSLDPLSMIIHTAVGDAYYYAREYDKSVVYYRMAIELDPRFDGAHTDLARSLEALGRFDEAQAQYEEGRRLAGGVAGPSFGLAHLEASRGNTGEARRLLAELTAARAERVVSAWGIAALHACLGDVDEAFRWLDTAVEEQATGLIFLRVHPRLDRIRDDARFPALLRRVGLAEPPPDSGPSAAAGRTSA